MDDIMQTGGVAFATGSLHGKPFLRKNEGAR
jgi:hypothetical protein